MSSDPNPWNEPDPRERPPGSSGPFESSDDIVFIDSQGRYSNRPYAAPGGEYDPPIYIDDKDPPAKPTPPQRGFSILAWLCILITLVIILGRSFLLVPDEASEAANFEGLAGQSLEMQAKFVVGGRAFQKEALKAEKQGAPLTEEDEQTLNQGKRQNIESAKDLATGSPPLRVRAAILAGEFGDADDALETLEETRALMQQEADAGTYQPNERDEKLMEVAESLFQDRRNEDFEAGSLSEEDRRFLTEELGWFGELALHPEDRKSGAPRDAIEQEAMRMFGGLLAIMGFGAMLIISGLVAAVVFMVLYFSNLLKSRVTPPSINGGIYAETFALWLFGFSMIGFAFMFVRIPEDWALLVQLIVFFGSLSVLIWPVLRGVPFAQVRRDVGLTFPSAWEVFFGFTNYLAALPLLLIGLLFLLLLGGIIASVAPETTEVASQLSNPQGPTHPIAFEIADASPIVLFQLIVLACVAAPIVEETMFRGVLYRHLRDSTAFMRIAASVLFSTLLNAFIFAIIHPQGLLGVPVLMALAIGFSLSREWRGSLVASMVSHGVSNGITMGVMLFVFS